MNFNTGTLEAGSANPVWAGKKQINPAQEMYGPGKEEPLDYWLNRMGEVGWEVVGVSHGTDASARMELVVILKRPRGWHA